MYYTERAIAEIDLDAIAHNTRTIRKAIPPSARMIAIVKADAYGHGAVETAKVLLYNGADSLGVAMLDEGLQLRENNIHVPVLILGYTPEQRIGEAVKAGFTQTVFSLDTAKQIADAARKLNTKTDVHIKVDTGMGRLGFLPTEECAAEIAQIANMPNVEIKGVYTHFSDSDANDKAYTYYQAEQFRRILTMLERRGISIPFIHASNSAAVTDYPELAFNGVRTGIIIYGLYPSANQAGRLDLRPAMSLKTHISYVKRVPKGSYISYGRTYVTDKESIIATAPIGYADGLPRILSNRGRAIVGGAYAPIVGNICMDQLMLDITGIAGVTPGDEIVIIGRQNGLEISADELAGLAGTINYEIVCSIGKRIPRAYIKNNKMLRTVNMLV